MNNFHRPHGGLQEADALDEASYDTILVAAHPVYRL